jgi:hypothetical protein
VLKAQQNGVSYLPQREGYLLIDHRASPGLPDHIAAASGFDPMSTRGGRMFEAATLTCKHCKTTVIKNPYRARERHTCARCSHGFICDECALEARMPDYDHTPFEAKIDRAFSDRARRAGNARILLIP